MRMLVGAIPCLLLLATSIFGHTQWSWRNPLPQGNTLTSVTWCGNRFVAVGEAGTILVSPDGMSWQNHSLDTTINLQCVACSDSRFVVVGERGAIFTSADAEKWTPHVSGTERGLNSVIWIGNTWVAVGDRSILTSPDGFTWNNALTSDLQDRVPLTSIAWNGETLVATGGLGAILTSNDGRNWTDRSLEGPTYIHNIVWTGTAFAAIGSLQFSLELLTSANGIDWERKPINAPGVSLSPSMNNLLWDGSRFMLGGGQSIATSTDGVNWTSRRVNTLFVMNSLARSGTRYVAVGGFGNMLVSQDGVDWTLLTQSKGWKFRDITWAGDKFVAVGDDSAVLTSNDGITWEPIPQSFDSTLAFSKVLWTGSRLIAFANSSIAMTSQDGKTWNLHEYAPATPITDAIWTGSSIVAVGMNGVYISKDGATWDYKPAPFRSPSNRVAWNGSRLVVVNLEGILVSPDGENWSPQSFDTSVAPMDIAWSGSRFVVVCDKDILTSPDGHSWTRLSLETDQQFTLVTWDGTRFIAVNASGYLYLSADGLAWTRQFSGTYVITGIAYNDDLLVLTSYHGAILSSPRQPLSIAAFPKGRRFNRSGRFMNPMPPASSVMYSADGRALDRAKIRRRTAPEIHSIFPAFKR